MYYTLLERNQSYVRERSSLSPISLAEISSLEAFCYLFWQSVDHNIDDVYSGRFWPHEKPARGSGRQTRPTV